MEKKDCMKCEHKEKIIEKYRKLLYGTYKQQLPQECNCKKDAICDGPIFETYEKTQGFLDLGKEYEYLTSTLKALKFATNDEIQNFRMTASNKIWDKFDDIEIDTKFKNGSEMRFLFQVKMTVNDNEKLIIDMSADGKTFRKNNKIYLMNFVNLVYDLKRKESELNKTTFYILYTNFATNLKDEDVLGTKKSNVCLIAKEVDMPFKTLLLATPEQKVFQFKPQTENLNPDLKKSCECFYLVFGQPNIEGVKKKTKLLLRELFHTYIYEYYEQFIRNWWQNNFVLYKSDLVFKLAEFILSPYIKSISNINCNKKTEILEKAIMSFELTLLKHDKENIACNIWSQSITDDEWKMIPPIFEITNHEDATDLQITKVMWYLGKAPLVISAEELEISVLKTVLKILKSCSKRRLVLLGEIGKIDLVEWRTFKNLFELEFEDYENYSSLIKNFKVSIQGKNQITLEDLLLIDYKFSEMFSIDRLLLLSQEKHLQIGKQNEDVSNFYVHRRLSKHVIKPIQITEVIDENDIVIINCLKPFENELHLMFHYHQNVLIIENATTCFEYFYKECEKNKGKDVYCFQQIDEEFCTLMLQRGNNKFKDFLCEKEFQDEEVFKKLNGFSLNVLCGPAGMGKSQLTSFLSNSTAPDVWSLKISLIHFNAFLSINPTYEEAKEMFLTLNNDDEFIVQQMKELFLKNRKFYLIIDALDEVNSVYLDFVLDFVKKISLEGVKVWISSREHLNYKISQTLNAVPIKIKRFNQDEEMLFIRKKLQRHYKKEELDEIQKTLSDNMHLINCREILEIPLQLHIITEVFLNSTEAFYSLRHQKVMALTKILKLFFFDKVRTTFKKLEIDVSETPQLGIVAKLEDCLEDYEVPALQVCLESVDFKKLDIKSNSTKIVSRIQNEGDKFGIVKEINSGDNNNVIFGHKIYAVYFACVWFKKHCQEYPTFGKEIMFSPKYEDLRRMFDVMMAENNPLHLAVIYNNPEQFRKYLDELPRIDTGGRTAAHLVFSYGQKYLKFGNNEIKTESEPFTSITELLFDKKFDLFCEDNLIKCSPLEYALRSRCLYPIEKAFQNISFETTDIVKKFSEFYDVTILIKDVLSNGFTNIFSQLIKTHNHLLHNKIEGNSLLHFAALKQDNEEIINLLLRLGLKVDIKNDKGQTPLHLATQGKLIRNIEILLNAGASPILPDYNGYSAFFWAVAMKQFDEEFLSMLTDFVKNINFKDGNGNTALLIACQKGCINSVKMLINKGADVNALNNKKQSALHYACLAKKPNKEVIEFLITDAGLSVEARDDVGETPLFNACHISCIENVATLLENGADVNAVNKNNKNILRWVNMISMPNAEMMSLLKTWGLEVNSNKVFSVESLRDENLEDKSAPPPLPKRTLPPAVPMRTRKDQWQIKHSSLKFVRRLAHSRFREVWEGTMYNQITVAIKTCSCDTTDTKNFLEEAKLLKQIKHPKVVQLYALCTIEQPFYIVTEFLNKGSLLEFLRENGKKHGLVWLIDTAGQIASGMGYLAFRNCIHGNLAATNVLVNYCDNIKIGGFRLARSMKQPESSSRVAYKYEGEVGLNDKQSLIKWMAPEVASHNRFSEKSDVWSFGILLTELITYGKIPYPDMSNSEVLDNLIEKDYRMPPPSDCPPEIYQIMLDCWKKDPIERPKFETLEQKLSHFIWQS